MDTYNFSIFFQSTSHLPIEPTSWSSRKEFDLCFFLLPQGYVQPKRRHSAILTIIFIGQEANVPYLRTPLFSILVSDFLGVSHIKRVLDESRGNFNKNRGEAPMPEIICIHLLRNQLLYICAGLTTPTSISCCGLNFSSLHILITELFYNGINFNNQDITQICCLIR